MSAPEPDAYERACRDWAEGRVQIWLKLRELLGSREGWWFGNDDGPAWYFGLAGAARLVITVDYEHLHLYDHDNDRDHPIANWETLIWWLDKHEGEHEGFTEGQEAAIDDLLPGKIEEWREDQPPA